MLQQRPNRQARPAQVEGPGHAVGDPPWQAAGDRHLPGVPQCSSQQWPGVAGDADEHVDIQRIVGMAQHAAAFVEVPAVFPCMPGASQEQPFLRVEAGRFAWRNAAELCVEALDILEKTTPFSIAQAVGAGIGISLEKALQRPALARNLADRIQALQQVLLEPVEVVGIGNAPVQAHDCDIQGVTVRPPKGKWSEVRPGAVVLSGPAGGSSCVGYCCCK
jgi:hypothetical protein